MNKSELVSSVATNSGLSKVDSLKVLDAITKIITNAMSDGNSVQLTGFGSFIVKERAARIRCPQIGEANKIATSKASKPLKEAVK